MDIVSSWMWLAAAVAVVAGVLRAVAHGEKRLARSWPDLHARWGGRWRLRHALAAAMAAVGIALACGAHGPTDGVGEFLACIVWALAAAAVVYLAEAIYIAILVCLCPLLLPDVLGGLRHAWRHRRDPAMPASDWLPPGSARLAAPVSREPEP